MSYSNKDASLSSGLPVGRYIWVSNHDGFQMKPSISKISREKHNIIREIKDSPSGQKE